MVPLSLAKDGTSVGGKYLPNVASTGLHSACYFTQDISLDYYAKPSAREFDSAVTQFSTLHFDQIMDFLLQPFYANLNRNMCK